MNLIDIAKATCRIAIATAAFTLVEASELLQKSSAAPHIHKDPEFTPQAIDARGIPTRVCPTCGCDLFTVQMSFDADYSISQYLLNAECSCCGTLVTAPTPLDHGNM